MRLLLWLWLRLWLVVLMLFFDGCNWLRFDSHGSSVTSLALTGRVVAVNVNVKVVIVVQVVHCVALEVQYGTVRYGTVQSRGNLLLPSSSSFL